jgi:hypothetical protein
MRREIMDKIVDVISSSKLFTDDTIYPRRYFDDLCVQMKMDMQQTKN